MKILILSLLRAGDLLMQKHLLSSVKAKYPEASLHLLVQRECENLVNLFPEVERFFYFERKSWQKQMASVEENILRPWKELKDLVQVLNAQDYQISMNWTHRRDSAYLMELIQAKEKQGLQTVGGEFCLMDSPVLREFNHRFSDLEASQWHYIEFLSAIFQLPKPLPFPVRRTFKQENARVYVHPLTSDDKKNWGLPRFKEWIELHRQRRPQDEIIILGAPSEKGLLESAFPDENLQLGSFAETLEHLRTGDLLIVGDTSIKHLAVFSQIPILEICLGGSQPSKTSPWSSKSYLSQPQVACWPCPHSSSCSQKSHRCAEELLPTKVEMAVEAIEQQRTSTLDFQRRFRTMKKESVSLLRHNQGDLHVAGI